MKIVIADPKKGKCYQIELDAVKSKPFYGLKIGESFDGSLVGLVDYKLEITGGTDKDGFPMRKDVHGMERKKVILSDKPGFISKEKGERRRKTIRGNTLSEDIAQVNVKILEYGKKSIPVCLGIKTEEAEEKPEKKEKTERKKEEVEK